MCTTFDAYVFQSSRGGLGGAAEGDGEGLLGDGLTVGLGDGLDVSSATPGDALGIESALGEAVAFALGGAMVPAAVAGAAGVWLVDPQATTTKATARIVASRRRPGAWRTNRGTVPPSQPTGCRYRDPTRVATHGRRRGDLA